MANHNKPPMFKANRLLPFQDRDIVLYMLLVIFKKKISTLNKNKRETTMIENFKTFLENEEKENVKDMISRLPKKHQKLLDGYKIKFTPGNTLHGDDEHIGYIHKNKIVVAAPWNYGRCFTFLHEVAHLFYEKLMTPNLKKEWSKLVKSTVENQKNKLPEKCHSALNQGAEEIFCMVYASTYSKHPPVTYLNKDWQHFIQNKLPG
jgi:hypothetical protein